MPVYYNEIDKYPAQWLRNLSSNNHIPKGVVDERSITEINPDDLKEYTQCHFFAGIGGWPYALRLAGWPDEREVWTGSCPCQPFSAAGKKKGVADERHLWPAFRWLIAKCRPPVIFGEQVASKLGREWLNGVRSDLEALGYEVGAADLCAPGVGAPHIRQRLFWVAYSEQYAKRGTCRQGNQERSDKEFDDRNIVWDDFADSSMDCGLAPAGMFRPKEPKEQTTRGEQYCEDGDSGVDNPTIGRCKTSNSDKTREKFRERIFTAASYWSDYSLIPCADGKARRIKPGIMPLAHGVPCRVGAIKGYGNAIVPQCAATFIECFNDYQGHNNQQTRGMK